MMNQAGGNFSDSGSTNQIIDYESHAHPIRVPILQTFPALQRGTMSFTSRKEISTSQGAQAIEEVLKPEARSPISDVRSR